MAEHLRVDSQKIMFHTDWMARWKNGRHDWRRAKSIYPIQVEIAPSGACNHHCAFCAMDFTGHKPRFISRNALLMTLKDMSKGGVKSVMYSGEGEPGMNPELPDIIVSSKKLGLDVGLQTNGSCLNERFLEKSLRDICWIKVSIDAGRRETYQKIHRPKNPGDWEQLFENLKFSVRLKRENNYQCRIGAQLLLLPQARDENGDIIPGTAEEAIILAEKLKKIGLNYFIIKPYSHQPLSLTRTYKNLVYKNYKRLEKTLKSFATDNFEIIFRSRSMQRYSTIRNYHQCLAIPFAWTYIMSDGSVYSCSVYLGDERFYLGNINEQSFKEIWEGSRRKKQWKFMQNFNLENCRKICIMDRVNEYLWEAANPPYNINFI